jgi:hypothetical protein
MHDDDGPRINGMVERDPLDDHSLQRRDFFKGAGTLAGLIGAAGLAQAEPPAASDKVPAAKPGPVLPTVAFGKYKITRLVAGANTIYGYSHFNYVYSAHMADYHSTARVLAFLRELERAGLNTWQASWSERLETDWLRYKEEGGKLQLLMLSRPGFNDEPEMLKRAMRLKPMGIGQHGVSTNKFWDAGTFDKSLDYLKRIRDTGAMVGISCHNPLEVEYAEDHGWGVDYYMTSLYYMIRPRAEFEKLLGGHLPLGEVYLPADPPRMLEAIRKAKKPCLAFKILAAGRTVDSPQQVKERMAVALKGIKPGDAMIIGLYQRFNDQIGQTAQFVREILA